MTTQHHRPAQPGHRDPGRRALSRRAFLWHGVALGTGVAAAGALDSLVAAAAPAASLTGSAPRLVRAQDVVRRGGTMTYALSQINSKMDPIWSQSRTEGIVLNQMIEGLVRPNRQGTDIEPALADNWEISGDGLSYTFHLRPGIKFHNGKPVTPEDVIASLERGRTNGTYKWSLENVDSFTRIDESTVRITLKTRVASFLARVGMLNNAIFPKEEIDRVGTDEITEPVGTGPFKLVEWVRGDHITLRRFEDYWGMGTDGQHLPYLDELVFKLVSEPSTQVLQVQVATVNAAENIPWSQLSALDHDPRTQLMVLPQQQVYFMVVNLKRPPFDDVLVRRAMSLALDRQAFVEVATAGRAEVANSFMPKSGADWNPELSLPYNVDQAKQLIAQSKYPNGHSGAKLQLANGSALGRDNAVLSKDMWEKIGINVEIQEVEASSLYENFIKTQFDAVSGYQWTNGMPDPEQLAAFFFLDPRMNSGYEPAQSTVDLCKAAAAELDPEKRRQMYYELQRIYNEDVGGTITLYYTPSINYLSANVKNYFRTPLGVPLIREVWLDS